MVLEKSWESIKSFWKCLHSNCTRQKSNERLICPLIVVFGKFHVSLYTDFPEILFLVQNACKFENGASVNCTRRLPKTFDRNMMT